jgi:hypothetical protein
MDDADRSGRFQHLPVRVDAFLKKTQRQSGNEKRIDNELKIKPVKHVQ